MEDNRNEVENALSDQAKVISLFQFIQELNKLKQKAILNVKDYPWSFSLSDLPNDPENISLHYQDRVSDDLDSEKAEDGNLILSVHKPEFQKCPEPELSFELWLEPGWNDFRQEASVIASMPGKKTNALRVVMSPVRMQLPVTAAAHMTKKQAHLGLLPASELRKGRTMAQKQKLQNSGMQIPDDAILRIAQAMLPLMQQYFESEEGRLQLSRQTEALEQKEAAPASQPAPPLIFAHYLCVDIKIINPNPSPIRKKFGFINNGDPYGNR